MKEDAPALSWILAEGGLPRDYTHPTPTPPTVSWAQPQTEFVLVSLPLCCLIPLLKILFTLNLVQNAAYDLLKISGILYSEMN